MSEAHERNGDTSDDRFLAREEARAAAKKRRVMKRRRMVVIAAALVVLLIIIIASARSCGTDPAPDIVGLSLEEATELVDSAGLTLVTEEVPSFEEVGTVLSQSPLPDIMSEDDTVTVTIARAPIEVQVNRIAAYDPDGDNLENDNKIGNLTDKDPATSWSTEKYKAYDFSGPLYPDKHGVGLQFSLAEEASMIELTYTVTGWTGQVQKVTTDGTGVAVAVLGQSQEVYLSEAIAVGRLWFTELTLLPDSDRYGVVLNEVAFYK